MVRLVDFWIKHRSEDSGSRLIRQRGGACGRDPARVSKRFFTSLVRPRRLIRSLPRRPGTSSETLQSP